jgi:6-bladed beta-propeller protein
MTTLIGVIAARALVVGLITVAVVGCAERRSGRGGSHVRDSAGVKVIENESPAWRPEEAWRLGDVPLREFGAGDSLFRIGNAIRLYDGGIIVSHNSANEIRIYSPTGQLVSRFGRAGSGPGEFQDISRLLLFGALDSLLVFDFPQRRATVFDLQGKYVRGFVPQPLPNKMAAFVDGAFKDGSLLVSSVPALTPEIRGLVRPVRSLWRYSPDGKRVVQLAAFPGQETFFQETPFGVDRRRPFFGHTESHVAWKNHVYWGITDRFEINVQSQDGALLSVIRIQERARSVSAADVNEIIRRRVDTLSPAMREPVRRVLLRMPAGGNVPAFGWPVWSDSHGSELQVDDDGNVWVVQYFEPNAPRNARTIFDANGRWLGTVRLPPRFTPLHLGADVVLGKWLDSMDVEHLQLYQLIKPTR